MSASLKIGVVGAGVSGLTCATTIVRLLCKKKDPGHKANFHIVVLEWGRGVGGRTAQRRVRKDGVEYKFDHAAPYFTAKTDAFRTGLLADWIANGLAAPFGDGDAYVGTPSNHAPCKAMSAALEASGYAEMRLGRHAKSAVYNDDEGTWRLTATRRSDGLDEVLELDALCLSDKLLVLPNEYAVLSPDDAARLLPPIPQHLGSRGCVVLLLAYRQPLFDDSSRPRVLTGRPGSVLDVAVCESAKPGRGNDNDAELWTVRSTASFAERHLIGESLRDETAAKEELLGAFSAVVGVESASSPHVFEVFAWDHSQPVDMISGASCSLDADRRLGVCGDFYCGGGVGDDGDDDDDVHGVEASARSGDALARALADAFL